MNPLKPSLLKKQSKKIEDKRNEAKKQADTKKNLKTLKVKKGASSASLPGDVEPPPLPPPADEPPLAEAPPAEAGALVPLETSTAGLPTSWIVAKEMAGREYWGCTGTLVSASDTHLRLNLEDVPGTREFRFEHLQPVPAEGLAKTKENCSPDLTDKATEEALSAGSDAN